LAAAGTGKGTAASLSWWQGGAACVLGEASRSMLAMVGILMAISMLQVLDKLLSFLHLKV
jgi:hypothetical protein